MPSYTFSKLTKPGAAVSAHGFWLVRLKQWGCVLLGSRTVKIMDVVSLMSLPSKLPPLETGCSKGQELCLCSSQIGGGQTKKMKCLIETFLTTICCSDVRILFGCIVFRSSPFSEKLFLSLIIQHKEMGLYNMLHNDWQLLFLRCFFLELQGEPRKEKKRNLPCTTQILY